MHIRGTWIAFAVAGWERRSNGASMAGARVSLLGLGVVCKVFCPTLADSRSVAAVRLSLIVSAPCLLLGIGYGLIGACGRCEQE